MLEPLSSIPIQVALTNRDFSYDWNATVLDLHCWIYLFSNIRLNEQELILQYKDRIEVLKGELEESLQDRLRDVLSITLAMKPVRSRFSTYP